MTLRWGVLGTAQINRRLIPAMRAARRSRVTAVASRSPERAARYAAEWQIPTAHAGYDTLLHDAAVDAVYIPLPNSLHVEWTLRALEAGKHVLCEKPLALTPEDVDRVVAVATATGRVVAEAFMYRHEPLTHHLLELIQSDALGAIAHIAVVFTYEQNRVDDVRLVPELGGGCLWDVGCYGTSLIRLLARAEPVEVSGWATIGPTGVDDTFLGTLRFAAGMTGNVHCSFRSVFRQVLDVYGREGSAHVELPFKPDLRHTIDLRRGEARTTVAVDGSPLHFQRLVEDFISATLDGRAPIVSLAESRGNAATLAALYASARSGRRALV